MKSSTSFLKSGHLPTLFSSFLYFDISFMIWVLFGAVGNYVATDLGLSPTQKGLMTALPLLGGAALRLVLGAMGDWIGSRKTGLIGIGLTFLPLLGGWLWADSVAQVYLVGLLLGVAGASFAVALPLVSRWYPAEHQGLAMGIAGAGNSGTLLATLLAPRLAEAFGWNCVFAVAMIPMGIAGVVFFFLAKEAPGQRRPQSHSDFASLLKEGDTLYFAFFYSLTFGGFVGLASFLSIMLRDQYGVSKIHAGDLTSLCVLSGSLMRPLGGWLADKLGGVRLLSILYGCVAMLALSVAQLPSLPIAMVFFFLLMACLGMGNGSVFQLVPQRFGKRVGIATGLLGAAGGVGGFFLPTVFGWLKQVTGSYQSGLLVFSTLAFCALAALLVRQRKWIGHWVGTGGMAMAHRVTDIEEGSEVLALK